MVPDQISFLMQKYTIVENPNSVFSKNIYKLLQAVNYMHPLMSFQWLLSKVQQIVVCENMKNKQNKSIYKFFMRLRDFTKEPDCTYTINSVNFWMQDLNAMTL